VVAEVASVLQIPNPVRPQVFDSVRRCTRRIAAGTFFFVDDNFALDRNHAIQVCKALAAFQDEHEIHIPWFTQTDVNAGFDDELLSAMKDAGCVNLFIGFESLSAKSLDAMHKSINTPERYLECIRNVERHGIEVTMSIIVGHDCESRDSLKELTEFAIRNNVFYLFPNILTPYPGTRLGHDIEAEGRISSRAPELYNVRNVVFEPKCMSALELRTAYVELCQAVLNVDRLCRAANERLRQPARYRLAWVWRVTATVAFAAILVGLALRRVITRHELTKLLHWMPRALLCNGSPNAMGFLANIVNFSTFARSEQRRLAR
jgi:radical SAM superfamily enzyme YgiQ (UPF0313 family)